MHSIKLTLAYDGTRYAGWQVQRHATTVQEVLETVIAKITGERVRVIASGRTDAGVHALGQVVGFRTETHLSPEVLRRALNAELPCDVAVLRAEEAGEHFHPIRDAVCKRYRYAIHDGPVRDVFRRRYAWHYPRRLDEAAMARAAAALVGTHDFRSFENSGAERKDSIRTVYALEVERGDGGGYLVAGPCRPEPPGQGRGAGQNLITIEVEADGFLYNMVRAIVGTLVEVGRGARPEDWVAEVLAAQDRRTAGPTAPPHGLFLVHVDYGTNDE